MSTGGETETITVAIKKHHMYLALGVVLGFGVGYATAMVLSLRVAVAPAAVAALPDFGELTSVEVQIEGRPYRGPDDAPVTLLEFTDYECPFCARHFQQTYPGLLSEYEGRLKYVIRNFPLSSIHPQAQRAAEAAECAEEQGRFWEYHDLLFQRAPALGVEHLTAYATETGLDAERFEDCLESGRKADVVAEDFEDGLRYGVSGTPTFFINGRRVVGTLSLDEFESYIDAALDEAQQE